MGRGAEPPESRLASGQELAIEWSEHVMLADAVDGVGAPAVPGLCRIRRIGTSGWDYIGQTGTSRRT